MPEPHSSNRKSARVLAAVLAVLGTAALLCILWPRERLLSNVSTRLAFLNTCVATDSFLGTNSEGYAWLSNDDLLVLRATPTPQGLAQVEAFRYNIHSQQETPLADFNRKQAKALVGIVYYPADATNPYARWGLVNARLSPDRQQLLWLYGSYGRWKWHVARLDGTNIADCKATDPQPSNSPTYWLPDSLQWATVSNSLPLALRFYSTKTGRREAIKNLTPMSFSQPIAFLRNGRLLTSGQPGNMPLTLGEANWQDKQPVNKFHSVNLPGVNSVNEIAVSPDETRLALYCRLSQSASLSPFMQQMCAWLHLPDRSAWAICTCRMDGSDLREIGRLPEGYNPSQNLKVIPGLTPGSIALREAAVLPHNLKWSPDGKRLSYCQGNALYMVPAE